jgi:hypothetical protein
MIKFTGRGFNGKKVIGIGLTEENIERLKQDDPILFSCESLGLDDESQILIVYDSTKFKELQHKIPPRSMYVLALNDDIIERLRDPDRRGLTNDKEQYAFFLYYGKDQAALVEKLNPELSQSDEDTQFRTEGYHPSYINPTNFFGNN